jgi:hypothetical protein
MPPNAGKGRPKGTPNKITASVKAALSEAFDQLGGVPSLVAWGLENPSAFYPLWAKMLPAEVDVTSNGQTISDIAAAAYARAEELRAEQQLALIDAPSHRLLELPAILS